MRKVLLIGCLMTAIAASAQSEEWIPDSVEVDTVAANVVTQTQPDIVEVEWTNRYAWHRRMGNVVSST